MELRSNYFYKIFILIVLFCIIVMLWYTIKEDEYNVMREVTIVMNVTAPKSEKYYVYTSNCRMPYLNPYSNEVMEIYKPTIYHECAPDKDFVRAIFDRDMQHYRLEWSPEASEPANQVKCCYRRIVRARGEDVDIKAFVKSCVNFKQNFTVPKHINGMIVDCKSKHKVQKLAFAFVQNDPISNSSTKLSNATLTKRMTRYPNVLIFGIDSLSRTNFERNMPLTHAYLKKQLWYELEGYNKMGDNTYPNLMALLTGYDKRAAFDVCKPTTLGGLDECKFLWHHYKAQGYHTAYGEDYASISTFNYGKLGFKRPPTDHYLRPFIVAISEKLKENRSGGNFCRGRKHYAEYVLDYAREFINVYRDEPIFGLFWLNSFSHNEFNSASSMDERVLTYLRDLEAEGVFEKSIVLLLSDHGMRYGRLSHLSCGFLEERLPMFFISLPQWFQNAHPDFIVALNINRNRLTSPYDIHSTLLHVLSLNAQNGHAFAAPYGCSRCHSIFRTVAEQRTCDDAGISDHWCTCESFVRISVQSKIVEKIAKRIINEINDYLIDNEYEQECAKLALRSVESAEQQENFSNKPRHIYRIKFIAAPSLPKFEATVIYNVLSENFTIDVESISRLNSYKYDADCIGESIIQKFCICLP